MSITGDRLREAMTLRGVDQKTLADAVGCSQGAISQILMGNTTRSRFLPEIADYLDVSLRWLRGETDDPDIAAPKQSRRLDDEFDLVPIQRIDLEYGMGEMATNVPIETDVLHFPRAWVEAITSTPPALLTFARGRGDSMQPTIQDNDMILIDRSQQRVLEQDAIWAVAMGDVGMIKRVRVRGESVILLSDNAHVPEDRVTPDEIYIVGRVVFIGRRL